GRIAAAGVRGVQGIAEQGVARDRLGCLVLTPAVDEFQRTLADHLSAELGDDGVVTGVVEGREPLLAKRCRLDGRGRQPCVPSGVGAVREYRVDVGVAYGA